MLEKSDFPDGNIVACLQSEYGLRAAAITLLPFGADFNTAVYRVTAGNGTAYFLKSRSGVFNEACCCLMSKSRWSSDWRDFYLNYCTVALRRYRTIRTSNR